MENLLSSFERGDLTLLSSEFRVQSQKLRTRKPERTLRYLSALSLNSEL